jgi:Putative zinc-finger
VTSWHPTDEDLILRFYGESSPGEAGRVDEHLRTCPACQAAWVDLDETLKLVDAATVPEPDAGFERVMWARVRQALPPRRPAGRLWRLLPLPALTAVVVVAVAGVYGWRDLAAPASTTRMAEAGQAAVSRERVLLGALGDHFEQTEMLLVEVLNGPDTGSELTFERAAADDLVASGRLYRATAQQTGDLQMAQMLDDLESVLVELARSPEHLDQADIASMRARIDDDGLLFKVRAVTNEVHVRQRNLITSEGPL